MAIDVALSDHRQRLSKALCKSFTDAAPNRRIRRNLTDIYRDKANPAFESVEGGEQDLGTILNLFQKFVRGHMLTLAFYAPKWAIDSRTIEGRGLDKRMQSFMTRYSDILNFNGIQKQLALDSAFGWAICKVDNGIAPKGITAPVAPRAYRINPDMFIVDPTAATVDECAYIGDIYLVPLNEAQAHEGFDPEQAAKLTEYRDTASGISNLDGGNAVESYAEPMTRLVDVYIAKAGKIYTWPCPNDEFTHVASENFLGERDSPINPYALLSLTMMPGQLHEIARLRSLRGLHLVANEMTIKGINQARGSQRNPVAPLGSEQDMSTALNAGDNNPIFLENKDNLGLYQIPGPDASILNLGSAASRMFSSEAGNLEVALGASAGADTARQTEALIGQITASQSLDRQAFEEFLGKIGQKMLTLAFTNEALELATIERVPGTQLEYSRLWAGPSKMPRTADISDFDFSIVPYSTAFRTPQERVSQLNQASQLIMQWMAAKGEGAPIAMEAVVRDVSEAFDMVPQIQEWWNGQEPTASERTSDTYRSTAQAPEGSDVRYQGAPQAGQEFQDAQQQGGVS